MCGIALILSEVPAPESTQGGGGGSPASREAEEVHGPELLVDDLRVALISRGPDSIGSKKVLLQQKLDSAVEEKRISLSSKESSKSVVSANGLLPSIWPCEMEIKSSESKLEVTQLGTGNETKKVDCLFNAENKRNSVTEVISPRDVSEVEMSHTIGLQFLGATLHLRGINPAAQPLVDGSGNILVYNGEIFGGIHVDRDKNDGETLLDTLEKCGDHKDRCVEEGKFSVPDILSSVKGPWALIYWQAKSRTLWFGRDAFGRRSLLVHWPTENDPQFVLSSVSPFWSVRGISGVDIPGAYDWEELSCGIYSLCMEASKDKFLGSMQSLISRIRKHEWTNALLNNLVKWERRPVDSQPKESCPHVLVGEEHALPSWPEICFSSHEEVPFVNQSKVPGGNFHPAQKLLISLRESVTRRTSLTMFKTNLCQTAEEKPAPLALLFSGGLDSMILAALSHQCLDQQYEIDLLNVSFDGLVAPDRISAKDGLKELQRIAPSRRWRLVEIDGDLSNLASETRHVMSLIHPAKTYMDLNIGVALWLAARGEGFVDGALCNPPGDSCRYEYKSTARILLVGAGADEQCAGYGRHRTKYRLGGWAALEEEMRLDMQRIWIRNMGRDDRCISDHGKEARFPFLDEDVVETLLEIPLREIAELDQPAGRGDKKILREVARLLGLEAASVLPKRAIQFGSRIARESNRMHFGSNRAANQASAGGAAVSRRQ
ncbi:unnamed protein product [Spirodela intermedia]|uniref:Uncharacterized protein n=1 Tax=Spirodela intermedia TaxID=51605 RepID=A0A7I8JVS2_SPIIN|nr:unnamed protein product [Spirodela intermedia]